VRLRPLLAAGLALAAISGLAACRTNVGAAAYVNGHRISESDVTKYLTPGAEPIPLADSNGQPTGQTVAPRSWVLRSLVRVQLLTDILGKSPVGAPTEAEINTAEKQLADAATLQKFDTQYVHRGYRAAFPILVLRENALEQIASAELQDSATADKLKPIIDDLSKKVTMNPRFGTWSAQNADITGNGPAVPSYLTLKPDYVPPNTGGTASATAPGQSG
jgi:hypothetical protein